MPVKKDLAALLGEDTAKPELRRGRGLRLSTAAAQDQAPKKAPRNRKAAPATVAAPNVVAPSAVAHEDVAPAPSAVTLPATHAATVASDHKSARGTYKLRLRKDLFKACKRTAKQQNRKLNRVIEEALDDYLRQRD